MERIDQKSNQIRVEIIIRDGCNFSFQTIKSLLQTQKEFPEMALQIIDIADTGPDRNTLGGITPSIWVNDKLLFLGSYSSELFYQQMATLSLNP